MTDEQMAALRAAAEKATPGAWEVETDLVGDYIQIAAFDATGNRALCIRAQSFRVADDATYIALANPAAVLALLDRVAAAEAREQAAWRAGRDAAAAAEIARLRAEVAALREALNDNKLGVEAVLNAAYRRLPKQSIAGLQTVVMRARAALAAQEQAL